MKKILAVMVLVLSSSWGMSSEMLVSEKMISADTVAIVDVHLNVLNKEQISTLLKESVSTALPPDTEKRCDDYMDRCKAAGCKSLSAVVSLKDGMPSILLVVGVEKGADTAKVTEFVKLVEPAVASMNPECPMTVDGCLVWCEKTLPVASPERFKAFQNVYEQLIARQALTMAFVPNAALVTTAVSQLPADDAAVAKAVLGGKGICLYTNLGAVLEPEIHLTVMASSADDATKLHALVEAFIPELKKHAPPAFATGIDQLKATLSDANVKVSIELKEWMKLVKDEIENELGGEK